LRPLECDVLFHHETVCIATDNARRSRLFGHQRRRLDGTGRFRWPVKVRTNGATRSSPQRGHASAVARGFARMGSLANQRRQIANVGVDSGCRSLTHAHGIAELPKFTPTAICDSSSVLRSAT
jgi:hypothetical protein